MAAAQRDAETSGRVVPEMPLLRARDGSEQRATFFELFFDLVYVFAMTQLSHHLLTHLDWEGAAQTTFLLLAVYWAWNYTTWMANWFDPETTQVRLVLVFVMLASMLMAVAIPSGFGEYALLFAASYSALQIGRNAFVVAVTPKGVFNRNFQQILAWSVLSAPLWIGGAVADDGLRWALWIVALGLDLLGPLARYWLPGYGTTPMSEWQIDAGHFAERFQLFVIIVLGESIVLAGATASDAGLDPSIVVALSVAFLSSTALWWLYFGQVAARATRRLASHGVAGVGQAGRDAFTYLHFPIIAGVLLAAVGDELVIAHPGDELGSAGALVALGGPALYLAGLTAFGYRMGRPQRPAPVVATLLLVAAIPLAAQLDGLVATSLVLAVLAVLVALEELRAKGRRAQAGVA